MTPQNLKDFRAKLGLTQQQLATILDVSKRTIIRWETEGRIPYTIELAIKTLEGQNRA